MSLVSRQVLKHYLEFQKSIVVISFKFMAQSVSEKCQLLLFEIKLSTNACNENIHIRVDRKYLGICIEYISDKHSVPLQYFCSTVQKHTL